MTRRVVAALEPAEGGWDVVLGAQRRRLSAESAPPGFARLPMPPEWAAHTPAELAAMLGRLDRNEPRDGDATAVGQHLHACLFAGVTWAELRDGGADLHLVLSTAAADLHRLPWELLHDGQGFLAAGSVPPVTISRTLGTADDPTRPVTVEPTVLVVVGGAFDESGLQPAAEYLALLDTLRQGELALHANLVVNATVDDVRSACADVKPDVVHLIAHGEQLATGRGYVELAPARPGDGPSQVSAHQLLEVLGAGGRLPQVLILTACRSAGTGMAPAASAGVVPEPFTFQPSLAAECVVGGVPIVSAMTGAITSRACREFTLGFYAALLRGGDAVEAAAAGRRSAFVVAGPSGRAVDWAYPAVFCRSGFDGRVEVSAAPALAARAARARQLLDRFRSPPAFCGRQDVLDAFRRVLAPAAPSEPAVLALCVPKDVAAKTRVGASRTLAQLGASASLAGWAVGRLAGDPGDDRAIGLPQLAGQLAYSAREAATALGATVPEELQLGLLKQGPRTPGLHSKLRELLEVKGVRADSNEAVGQALALDLCEVRRTIRAADQPGRGLVLLVDDLHACGPAVAPLLFCVNNYGLGTAADPVPLVFSYREGEDVDGSGAVREIVELVQTGPVTRVAIEPFAPPAAWLAYQQLLLGARPPLVPVAEHRDLVLSQIHRISQGVPDLFDKDTMTVTIEAFQLMNGIEPAADTDRLAALLGRAW